MRDEKGNSKRKNNLILYRKSGYEMSDEAIAVTRFLRNMVLDKYRPYITPNKPEGEKTRFIGGVDFETKKLFKFEILGYRVRLRIRKNLKPRILFNIYKPENWAKKFKIPESVNDKAR